MAVIKLSPENIHKNDGSSKIKLDRSRISVDSARVSGYETQNKESYDALEKYRQRINSGGYLSAEDLDAYRKALDSYVETSTRLRDLSRFYGQSVDDDDAWAKTIADMESGYRGISDYFSQWKTEVDFRAAMEQAKAYEKRMAELTNGYDPTKNQQEGMTGWDDFQAYLDRTKNQQQAQEKEKTIWDTILEGIGAIGSDTSLPGIGGSQVVAMSEEAQRNDTELAMPKERWTDEERYKFGYLWNTERQKAWDYARAVNMAYAKQDESAKIQGIQESATDNFWAGAGNTLGAIATSPLGMADYLKDLITYGAVGYIPQADGEISPFEYSQAVTSGVAQHLNDAGGTINDNIPVLGGKGWGDVYGLGTSIAQSSLAAYTGGSGQALITFFGSAAASGVDDALSRGADGAQALFYGTSVGAAEALAEMAGIDNLLKIGASAGKQLLFTLVKQAGAEGLEEGLTTFLGNVADQVWLGDKSNFYLRVQAYMSAGFSESEAKSKAWSELWGELAFDALGGFVSGGIHAGPQTAYHTFMQNSYAKNTYGGSQKELVGEALEINPDNAFAKKMQGRLDSGKNLSGGQLNALVQQNEATISEQDMASIQKAAAQRLTELGATENVEATAAALAKQAAGQELSHKEKQLIKEYGSVVSQEMNPENIRSGKYNAEWAQKIGTNKINANEYSRDLMDLAQEQTGVKSSRTNPAQQSTENAPADGTVDTAKENGAESASEADTGPVKVKSIASIKNKRANVALEDGTEADVKDVDLDPNDGVRIETIASIDGISATDANFIFKTLRENTGASAQMDALGAKDAYRYGFYGFSKDLMTKQAVFANSLTEAQRNSIYEVGQKARQQQIEKASPKTTAKKRGIYFDHGGGNVVEFKDADKNTLTEEKRKAGVQVALILNKLGIGGSIYFFESYRNAKGQLVYKDSTGKEVKAPNGWYSEKDGSIHIDLNAGRGGNGLVMFTLAHELTHFIEQWSPAKYKILADFLIENYEKGQSMDALIRKKQAELSALRGKEISYDEAYSEVIADSMEAMLADGNVLEKLIELKAKDQSLFAKMKQFFDNLLAKLRNAYKGQTPDSAEGKAVMEMTESIERIQQLFAEALVEASDNFQASLTPGEEGVAVNESGEPVAHATSDGTIQLSVRTYEEDGRKAFRDYLNKCVKNDRLTQAEMQEMLNGIEEIYQVCKEFKDKYAPFSTWSDAAVIRDTYGKPVFSVVTPNGDYKMNLDFSLVCKKRRTLDAVFNEMSKRGIIDDFELGQKSVVKINEIIRKYGLETACALCFVDAKRFRQASMADQFTSLYNELVLSLVPEDQRGDIDRFNFAGYDTIKKVDNGIHTWDKSKLDFSHLDDVMKNYGKGTVEHKAAKYIKDHAEGRRLLLRGDFMSSKGFDAVKTQNKDILKLYNSKKGTGGPKAAFGDVQYMNEIIKKSKNWTPEKAYAVGGVRIQSFSDYVPRMVFDYVQMIYDLAATKLPAHAYTKESLFVKQFGLTGIKINMSLIPAVAEGGIAPGLDANGNYVWAGESFDFDTAKEIQNADGYTENCGTICVGVSDLHIRKLLGDPDIRMVIPYHKSGLNPIVAHMNQIAEFTDYTGSQNTLDRNGSKLNKDFDFNKAMHDMGENGDPKAVIKQYLDWCDKNGYTPKFSQFRDHPNYYKLIEDFTLYDKNGKYVPQREVRAVFPTKDSAFGSMKDLIQSGLEEDAIVEGKRDSSLSSIVDEIQNTLPKTEAEISEEQVVQADHDLEEVKNSDRNYSYEALISKPDMMVTEVGGNGPNNRADVVAMAKKNAASVGRFDPKTGSVSVHVNDMDVDVLLGTDGLKHGLRRTKDAQNDANYIVTVKAGEILKNSIKVNEITPKKHNATGSYVLIGIAKNASGDMYIVRSVVNQFNNELASMDVLYAINAKKELAATKSPRSTAEPLSVTSSSISITELLDIVNQHFPDILPEDVLKHYGYDARPEGDLGENVLYSERDTDSVSNRHLLANAFEGVAQNDIEKRKIQEYKSQISIINAEERKLSELNQKIKDLSFAKGPKDTKAIRDLQFEAMQTANRINTMDKILLRLEASKPLQDVLTREKEKVRKREQQKGKEALEAYREKATKTQRELLEKWQESRKKGIDSRQRTAMRHKIQNVVKELNDLLLNESKKRHVPDSMKKAVADALSLVNMDTVGAEERAAKYAALIAKETDPDKIAAYTVTMENILRQGDKMGQRLKELRDAYEEIQESDDPDIANAYDPVIAGNLKELYQSIGNTSLGNMTIEQLSDVYDMYKMVLTRVRDANKTLLENIKENISNLASRVIGEVRTTGGEHKQRLAMLDPVRSFLWNNLKPVYAMEHIGSATLTKVFNNVRAGEDTWAKDVTEAREYYLAQSKKYGYDKWDFKKKYRFQSASGLEFELTLEQILSLYAYSKRDQAADHLRLGGFVFDSNIETYKEKGGKLKYRVNTADAHQITPEILADITGKLSKEQMGFVDEMQEYLSTTMGAKGNDVTMKMYGVKLFKEKFYFPLKSAKQFMFEQNEVSGEVKIKNSGFTNKVVAKANNPVILSNFMEVWSGHVNDMSMYHAFVLPLEDFNRVFNYNSPKKENQPSVSVKGTIQSAYSPAAVSYVKNLITDLNGGARTDSRTGIMGKLIGLHKKGAVFAALSVVVQQPSAIARAAALVDTKYFIGPKVDHKRHKALWDEVKQYAPVAIIKEMGYFDTNMGKSTHDYITSKEYSGFKEKMEALVTDSNYRDEILSKAPALADEIAWCSIWEAVKRETQAQHPGLDVRGEPFLMLAGSRFTEVITKTQVYDSVLSRSANMRSKDTGMKMATAFMAEPTTSINMIADALLQGKRGNRKYCRATIGAVIASQIINSILVSFVYAGRDDDEDETYAEKYIGTLSREVLDSLNPATYIPFIKDIVSIVQGYDVERSDMAIISDLVNAWRKLSSDNLSAYRKVEEFAGSIAQFFGLPVKNIMRDVRGIYQTIMSFVAGPQTTAAGIRYAIQGAVTGKDVSNQKQLYEAYMSGDKAQIARVESRYKDQSSITSAIRKALRENDPRILEAAQAVINGNGTERANIARAIAAEGHFSLQDIQAAINAEIDKLRKDAKDN